MAEYTYEVVWVAAEGLRAGMEVCREQVVVEARTHLAAARKVAATWNITHVYEGQKSFDVPAHWILHEVKFVSRV